MNMDCFLKRYLGILMNDENDAVFQTFKIVIGGTTSHRISKLLNFAVSQMGHDECYVETGVFTGGTLIPAFYNNGRTCIGIDSYGPVMAEASWCDPEKVKAQARQNINAMATGARLIEKDFREVTKEEIAMPIGVSFIDARHAYEDVLDNLNWLHPLLADHALVFFDDINFLGVSQAISKWLAEHGENYDLTTYVKPFFKDENYVSSLDRFMNNGLCILRYHRDEAAKGVIVPV